MTASSLPRLLVIMGSGETSPTMIKTHRELLERLGPPPVPAVLMDTPFGFQMNASDIAERAVEYFRESVGAGIEVAGFRSASVVDDTLAYERVLAQLRAARYVFAGPGSPSYALRQWAGTGVPSALAEKLRGGGCVCFASAAALTLGLFTVPVYEVYKVGEDPRWLPGLDLLSVGTGLRAAVIPHYDNAEGGNHDTRFCYLGEQRLSLLEADLPEDVFVLGVDEHTGLVLDLDASTATVVGRSSVTVRKDGRSSSLPTGSVVAIEELGSMASRGSVSAVAAVAESPAPTAPAQSPSSAETPFLEAVAAHEAAFAAAVADRDAAGAVRAILELDDDIVAWSRDTQESDEMDRARAALRSMIVRLGELAEVGARDPVTVVGPFIETLLSARTMARADKRWAEADQLRDRLVELGVEVNDTPEGTSWRLVP